MRNILLLVDGGLYPELPRMSKPKAKTFEKSQCSGQKTVTIVIAKRLSYWWPLSADSLFVTSQTLWLLTITN